MPLEFQKELVERGLKSIKPINLAVTFIFFIKSNLIKKEWLTDLLCFHPLLKGNGKEKGSPFFSFFKKKILWSFCFPLKKSCLLIRFWREWSDFALELRQYKNYSIQSTKIPILKFPLFFATYTAREKARQFQNWNIFFRNGVILILSLLLFL